MTPDERRQGELRDGAVLRKRDSTIELVHRVHDGEGRAVDLLFQCLHSLMRRGTSTRLPGWTRDLVDTDDFVQEAFTATCRNIPNAVPRRAFPQRGGRLHDEVRAPAWMRMVVPCVGTLSVRRQPSS